MLGNSFLSNEFRLAAACCRWPRSGQRNEALRRAVAAGIDWKRFLKVVRRQRVEGLASDALARADVAVPENVRAALSGKAVEIAGKNILFAAESVRLQKLFVEAKLPFLFVKGITLSMLAYGSLGIKSAWDIDMVVPADMIGRACALVREAGYERIEPGTDLSETQFQTWLGLSKETIWKHRNNGIALELHSRLVDNPMLLPGVNAQSPSQHVEIFAGVTLPTLRDEELFSYLCVHGATHAWSRLKWLADVAAFLRTREPVEIEHLYRRSALLGAGRCSAQALLLCRQLFDLHLPPAIEKELLSDPIVRRLASNALAMMAGNNEIKELDRRSLATIPIHLSHFLLDRRLSYKLAEAKRKYLSPYEQMAIGSRFRFIYPLLLMPAWFLRRLRGKLKR